MILPFSAAGQPSGRSRRKPSTPVAVESLEGRALLSAMSLRTARAHAAQVGGVIFPANPHPGPIVNELGIGFSVKSPRFYPGFTGTKRADLNAAGAKGVLDSGGNLVLTGIIAANGVNLSPASPADASFYTFAINRGTGAAIAPIPGRPAVAFDTLVSVAVTPAGVSASVTDLTTGNVTPLSQGDLLFKQNALQVTVPASVVSTIKPTSARTTATFIPSSAPFGTSYQSIASLSPEFRGFTIALGRIPHQGR